jgi:hypothetical protein
MNMQDIHNFDELSVLSAERLFSLVYNTLYPGPALGLIPYPVLNNFIFFLQTVKRRSRSILGLTVFFHSLSRGKCITSAQKTTPTMARLGVPIKLTVKELLSMELGVIVSTVVEKQVIIEGATTDDLSYQGVQSRTSAYLVQST